MTQDQWPWVIAGLAVTVALPVVVDWTRRQPPKSGRRLIGWGWIVSLATVTVDAILALNGVPWVWLIVVLAAGQVAAAGPLGVGWALVRDSRRSAEERLLRPDNVAPVEAEVWVRPRQLDGDPPRGLGGRVDRWLASDGPAPTAGWWHNGGLIVDEQGPALVDAAGLRHELPTRTAALVQVSAPRAVLLVDQRAMLLARLPTTGFDEPDLRRFAAAAGWRYDRTVRPGRTARHAVDLRAAVVDRAARDRRMPTRSRGVLRRPHR
ncbi:MAG TPA: hypothetical protein VHV74_23910 [Pseudonocardiaceae bacterium]|jgi:hypothetical protein|nr:hypothetical protein [Pseudonocardiaceae bacterium]